MLYCLLNELFPVKEGAALLPLPRIIIPCLGFRCRSAGCLYYLEFHFLLACLQGVCARSDCAEVSDYTVTVFLEFHAAFHYGDGGGVIQAVLVLVGRDKAVGRFQLACVDLKRAFRVGNIE